MPRCFQNVQKCPDLSVRQKSGEFLGLMGLTGGRRDPMTKQRKTTDQSIDWFLSIPFHDLSDVSSVGHKGLFVTIGMTLERQRQHDPGVIQYNQKRGKEEQFHSFWPLRNNQLQERNSPCIARPSHSECPSGFGKVYPPHSRIVRACDIVKERSWWCSFDDYWCLFCHSVWSILIPWTRPFDGFRFNREWDKDHLLPLDASIVDRPYWNGKSNTQNRTSKFWKRDELCQCHDAHRPVAWDCKP